MCNGCEAMKPELVFVHAVFEAFAWLEDHGYRPNAVDAAHVLYRGTLGRVAVYLDHGCEIAVALGPEEGEGWAGLYGLSELIRLVDAEAGLQYRDPCATSPAAVRKFVKVQAERLKNYIPRVLSGDGTIWVELATQQRQFQEDLAARTLLSSVAREARDYFREKDFRRVTALLSPYEDQLSAGELMRLEYARKKVAEQS